MAKRTMKLTVSIEVPFEEYKTAAENKRAESHIRRWLKDTFRYDLSFIPIYAEKDSDGGFIEDCSYKTKVSISQDI